VYFALTGLTLALGLLLTTAAPAFAKRGYESQITELESDFALSVDYTDSLWVLNGGNGGQISEYGPFSSNLTGTLSGVGNPFYNRSFALDQTTGSLYLANSDSVKVDVYENGTGSLTEEWGGFGGGFDYLAIDNSGGASNGTVYVAATSPDNIQAFHPNHTQAEFSANTESYIAGNRITGTPSGHFGFIRNIGVDSHGNIYLVDQENREVDEYKPSGEFVQSFTNEKLSTFTPSAVAVDPTNGNVLIVDSASAVIDEFSPAGEFLAEINGSETPAGSFGSGESFSPSSIAFNSEGSLYVADLAHSVVDIFTPDIPLPGVTNEPTSNPAQTSVTVNAKVNPNGDEVTGCYFEYGTSPAYGSPLIPCSPAPPYSGKGVTAVSANLTGLSGETIYHYRIVVTDASGHPMRGADQTFTLHAVADLTTEAATNLTPTEAQLNGSFIGNSEDTKYYFEYGTSKEYGQKTTESDAGSPVGPGSTPVSFKLGSLEPATNYHYRLVSKNSVGTTTAGDQEFTTPPAPPLISAEKVAEVHADTAQVHAQINPGAGQTTYHVAYGTTTAYGSLTPDTTLEAGRTPQGISVQLSGLSPGTTYHYQVVATNGPEMSPNTTQGQDRTFTTLPFAKEITDTCPNAHVRQQTSAAQLLDCRAYELVSAPYTAGYDVESNIVPGQTPLAGYPEAEGRVLYGIYDGAIPGVGFPTNLGVAPYLATRGQNGWSTEYVGIPSNATPSAAPFASNLLEADGGLDTFAFGGAEICKPCFADGSTGVPLRLPDGALVQGMVGPLKPDSAAARGYVAKPLSEDGTHLIFGSTEQFAPGGNEGQISIYDRDLKTNETHVVSNGQTGMPIPCLDNCSSDGIAELDISTDGSHILLGQLVGEANGAKYWHLYMNVSDSNQTVELTPAASMGVLFDGMTADGTKVFFSSEEHLTGEDEQHTGADIFMWEEGQPLMLISKGTEGDASSCDPSANSAHEHWNTSQKEATNCGVVAVGGGGGVANANGTIYFLSPSLLDGTELKDGVKNAPNLYVARPGAAPHFVATLDSSLNAPIPPKVIHPFIGSFGSFEKPSAAAIAEGPGEEGDTYVLDTGRTFGPGSVEKFDPAGNPITSFGKNGKLDGQSARGSGTLQSGSTTIQSVTTTSGAFSVGQEISATGIPSGATITGLGVGSLEISEPATVSEPASLTSRLNIEEYGYAGMPGGIAVDNDPSSPSYRDLYVPDLGHDVIDKFAPSGEFISQIKMFPNAFPSGAAVDQANGDLYVSEYSHHAVQVFAPNGEAIESAEIEMPQNAEERQENALGVGVASDGRVYVLVGVSGFGTPEGTEVYEPSSRSPLEYKNKAKLFNANPSFGVAVAPDGSVYLDEGTQVSQYDPTGQRLGAPLGVGLLKEHSVLTGGTASIGLGASSSGLVISNPGSGPGEFGDVIAYRSLYPPSPQTDNSLVVDSVSAPETRHTGDFQITPSGNYAVFPSALALADGEEETAGHTEVYRYQAPSAKLECVSCNPTGAPSAGEAGLAPNGLSITNEGRVFFATSDQLTAADTDNKQDVYEWEPSGAGNCNESSLSFSRQTKACIALISAGTSAFDSGLLGVDANGKDAYFFTRDTLVPQDKNGPTVKVYDAREGGGFAFEQPPAPCKASDECHGPSSPTPPPLEVGSESGTPHNFRAEPKGCKAGFVKRHGVCVRRSRANKHPRRAKKHHRGAHK